MLCPEASNSCMNSARVYCYMQIACVDAPTVTVENCQVVLGAMQIAKWDKESTRFQPSPPTPPLKAI